MICSAAMTQCTKTIAAYNATRCAVKIGHNRKHLLKSKASTLSHSTACNSVLSYKVIIRLSEIFFSLLNTQHHDQYHCNSTDSFSHQNSTLNINSTMHLIHSTQRHHICFPPQTEETFLFFRSLIRTLFCSIFCFQFFCVVPR